MQRPRGSRSRRARWGKGRADQLANCLRRAEEPRRTLRPVVRAGHSGQAFQTLRDAQVVAQSSSDRQTFASDGLRRGIYLYYGYWWLKRYEAERELPWQALEGASEQRLRLLGLKMPDRDLHMYDPDR